MCRVARAVDADFALVVDLVPAEVADMAAQSAAAAARSSEPD